MTSNKNTAAVGAAVAVVFLLLATMLLTPVADARPYMDVLPPSTSDGVVGNLLPHKIIPPSGPSDFWGGDEPLLPPVHVVVGNLLPHKIIPPSGPSDFWGGEPLPPVEVKINHGN
jgi:hypothetical protein